MEKDDEPELLERFGLGMFPTLVWTDAAGEVVARTVQPDSADDALADLEAVRDFLANPTGEER